jgi:HEAT repeat protein
MAGKRDRDDDDDRPRAKKSRRAYDDDGDDSPRKSSDGSGMVLAIVGGVFAVLLLLCGGGVLGVYYMYRKGAEAIEQAANAPAPAADVPVIDNPFIPGPTRPTLASIDDALRALKSADEGERRAALEWLARAPLDVGRQAEVSRAVNPFLTDPDNRTREKAVGALKVWCTRDNVDGLVRILNEGNPGPGGPPELVKGSMEVLGKLQDERGAEPVWRYIREGSIWWDAERAMKAMGPAAGEKATLKHLNDPVGGIRGTARGILASYATKDDAKVRQTLLDLKADDRARRSAAAEYLANVSPVVDSERPAVSQALNATLTDPDAPTVDNGLRAIEKWYTADNVPALVKMLDDDRSRDRHRVMALLGKIKDVRAAAPMAARLPVGADRRSAADALIVLGPVGKPAVEKYSTHPDQAVRREVERILGSYGADTSGLKLAQVLADLASPEARRRTDAARKLANDIKVDPAEQTKVARALATAVADASDKGAQEMALKALAVWGTKANGPALVKLIEDRDKNPAQVRHQAMDILARWKDEEAIKPIALNIGTDKGDREAAAKALMAMGPELGNKIEGVVSGGLQNPDRAVVLECVKVLGAVGTRASVAELNKLGQLAVKQKQRDVEAACRKALAEITLRGK